MAASRSPRIGSYADLAYRRWAERLFEARPDGSLSTIIRSFPGPGELFFLGVDRKMMAVPITGGAKFQAGAPKVLFDTRLATNVETWFDVSKDGRFLIPTQTEYASSLPLTVVVNWQAGLKQ